MIARTLLERWSRRWVVRRRMPARYGSLRAYVTPDASLRYWLPGLERTEPGLFRWVDELVVPGSTIWDVGANVGLLALAASLRAGAEGRVVAVEPDERLSELIRRSALKLPRTAARLDVLTAAVAHDIALEELTIARRGRAGNHLARVAGSSQSGGARAVKTVVTVSLDWLLDFLPAPDLVKIDTEGAEVDCLRGAQRLLAEVRPNLLCEVANCNTAAVGELLTKHGYELFDADLPAGERVSLRHPTWNTLAVPVAAGER